jgi:polyhydroxybutyrate depolymerase
MITRCLTVLAVIVSVAVQGSAQTRTMQIAGVRREYIVHAPSGLDNPPLVLNIHGFNMSASSEQSYTQMDRLADREKFIVVYPDALPNSNNEKSWDLSGENDFAFMLAIIDTIDNQYGIDRDRIYACGFSQGGFMSFQLGCRYSDIFAAIAPTSGTVNGRCNLERPVPMRLTFGTNEFDGGAAQTARFMESVMFWVDLLGCPETPEITRPYPPDNQNSVVTRLYYGPCDDGTEVIADSVRTGGHEWPMNTNDRINNSEETWAFLKKFSLPDETGVRQVAVFAPAGAVSATYRAGMVHLQGADKAASVRVIDTEGRLIASTTANGERFSFSNKPSGVYLVQIEGTRGTVAGRLLVP